MNQLDFDGRVAIVTGAGNGLGREHALLLASRGAHVLVNDLGGNASGGDGNSGPAQRLVDEITGTGGSAVANHDTVSTSVGATAIVQAALDAFGRIDIVVNNAGILRDGPFAAMSDEDFELVVDVHLRGTFNVTRAAWPHFEKQSYGRVVSTSSSAGVFGNYGQVNYAAAKMGVVGLSNALAIEGASHNIGVNVIAPIARTRLSEEKLGERLIERVSPTLVSPLVGWLAHEQCTTSGHLYTVGGGRVARLFIGMCEGWARPDGELTVEDIRDHFDEIENTDLSSTADSMKDDLRALVKALEG